MCTGAAVSSQLKEGTTLFQRLKGADFEHFIPKQRKLVNGIIRRVGTKLLAQFGQTFALENYIWTGLEDKLSDGQL